MGRTTNLPLRVFLLAVLAGAGLTCGPIACHPYGNLAEDVNDTYDLAYENPERAIEECWERVEDLTQDLNNLYWDEDIEKYDEDYHIDRQGMALSETFLTMGDAYMLWRDQLGRGAPGGAEKVAEAETAYYRSVEAASLYLGEHVKRMTGEDPQIYRTLKTFFRSKKVEMVAYQRLRDLHLGQGNEALATVDDIRALYAKAYLDSLVAQTEEEAIRQYESESAIQDDEIFNAGVTTGVLIVFVIVLVILGAKELGGDAPNLAAAAIDLAGHLVVAAANSYSERIEDLKLQLVRSGVGAVVAAVQRLERLPDTDRLPSFAEFREQVQAAREAADEGDDEAAMEAFLASHELLMDVEDELRQLSERYSTDPEAGPGEETP